MTDLINHPPHYTSHPSGVECLTITRHMSFNIGNAIKYIWRADLKGDSLADLRKAAFYIADEIAKREAEQPEAAKILAEIEAAEVRACHNCKHKEYTVTGGSVICHAACRDCWAFNARPNWEPRA